MSKVAKYLNEHLTGEVVSGGQDVAAASVDGSQLLLKPEIVAHVASTSDIRKIARFCWQLAEKGHALSVTVRGHGTDTTGAAIGSGIIISQSRHMNRVVDIDLRHRIILAQAGASYSGINIALSTHKGMRLPSDSFDGQSGSLGGAIASGAAGHLSAQHGTVGQAVKQLEVVLANGDILQTKRLSKRELSSKKGLHNMEGEVYRQVDNLISDNLELIQSMAKSPAHDTAGYGSITQVRQKNGSVDLTPLFVGSQGTLGIITEAIMQGQFGSSEVSVVLAAYAKLSDAQEAADKALGVKASAVEIFDGRLLKRAAAEGKKREFAPDESHAGGLVVAIFDTLNDGARQRATKKLQRDLTKLGSAAHISSRKCSASELADIYSILEVASRPNEAGKTVPGVFRGMWLPSVQLDSFLSDLRKIEKEYSLPLPIFADLSSGFVDMLPVLDMKKVSERQKLVKVLTAVAQVVTKHKGSFAGYGGDGRLKLAAVQGTLDTEVVELYQQIKKIFDPHSILNPGVKQAVSPKELAAQMNAWCRASL